MTATKSQITVISPRQLHDALLQSSMLESNELIDQSKVRNQDYIGNLGQVKEENITIMDQILNKSNHADQRSEEHDDTSSNDSDKTISDKDEAN